MSQGLTGQHLKKHNVYTKRESTSTQQHNNLKVHQPVDILQAAFGSDGYMGLKVLKVAVLGKLVLWFPLFCV